MHPVVDGVKDVEVRRQVNVVGTVRLDIIVSEIQTEHRTIKDSGSRTSKVEVQDKKV